MTSAHVRGLYREKLEDGHSPRTVQYIHVTLHKALKQAVDDGLIPRNATEAVRPPQVRKEEIRPLTAEQVKMLFEAGRGDRLESLYILAVHTGLRKGELLGLKWGDVDFEAGTLQARRMLTTAKGGPMLRAPKTKGSRRTVKLSPAALETLSSHLERQLGEIDRAGDLWGENGLIFASEFGEPLDPFAPDGTPRELYRPVLDELERMGVEEWERRTSRARERYLAEQHGFGILEGDKRHPTDWFPRLLSATDWEVLERGLAQRLLAVNEFLRRLEAGKEEVVPKEILETSALYDTSISNRFGEVPARQMGIDLVALEEDGGWKYRVIEDNARMPVGAMTMSRLRALTPDIFPEAYAALGVRPLGDLLGRLGDVLRAASPLPEPTLAILSTGPEDQYYLDHNLFAEETGAILAERDEVELDGGGYLVHKETGRQIDVIYERIEDGRIYDEHPRLIESHFEGRVQAIFAPNSEVVDDKGVYAFIPEMIRTYLGEESIIPNLETLSLAVEEDRRYVMEHFDELVIKSRSGWGGKDVLIAPEESREAIEEFRNMVEENPIEYVAQNPVDFSTNVLCSVEDGDISLRDSYADYRIHGFVLDSETVEVIPGAMTRVAAPGSRLVNVSSGGVTKDTWVLG